MTESAWTWKKPVEPGHYWFKPKHMSTGLQNDTEYRRALYVYKVEACGGQLFVACDRFSRLTSTYYEGGLWQKIPEPLP